MEIALLMAQTNRSDIQNYLTQVEENHSIRIIYAAESGSRAWGFASPDSDYDIRFLYAHYPKEYYLSFDIERRRDVLEVPDKERDWDCKGWDIKKALHLFTKSNASLLEWMNSPIVYIDPEKSVRMLKKLGEKSFDSTSICYHYWRLGRNNYREFMNGRNEVSIKKCLYVLRALLAVDWVLEYSVLPPVKFMELVEGLSHKMDIRAIYPAIVKLVSIKKSKNEIDVINCSAINDIVELIKYRIVKIEQDNSSFFESHRKGLRQGKWNDRLNKIYRIAVGT